MKASEALKKIESVHSNGSGKLVGLNDHWVAAVAALREKAEREEQERPKVTLADMVRICEATSRGAKPVKRGLTILASAADTLRKLDIEGAEFLQEIVLTERLHKFLRSLGVEKKP